MPALRAEQEERNCSRHQSSYFPAALGTQLGVEQGQSVRNGQGELVTTGHNLNPPWLLRRDEEEEQKEGGRVEPGEARQGTKCGFN